MCAFLSICFVIIVITVVIIWYRKPTSKISKPQTSQPYKTKSYNTDTKDQLTALIQENAALTFENTKYKSENEELNHAIEIYQNKSNPTIQEQVFLKTTISNLSKEIDLLQKKNENLLRENSNYIKENKELSEVLHEFNPYDDYRKRFPSPYRCDDGDWVRSKAEREIDNFFFRHRIWHIIEEVYYKKHSDIKYYPDFYLPDYNLYLEYFGGTDNEYLFKREAKIATYRADPSIRFEYLTFQDDARIEERLREICRKYSIRL